MGDVQWKRIVGSDPRENWYLALPAKLLPRQVEQIKRAGLSGDLWQQWQLEALMSDSWPMYRKCSHEIRQAVAGCRWVVRPYAEDGQEPTDEAQEKAALVRRSLVSMQPDRFTDEKAFSGMVYQLTDAILNGLSMVELQWHRVNGEKLPRAATWVHPRHYTFGRNGRLAIMETQDIGDMNLNAKKRGIGLTDEQMRRKFLCAQYASRSGSSLAAGLSRPVATWWSYWIYGREWIAVMAQKHGTPFLKGKYKTGTMDENEQARLEGRLRDAGPNNYVLIPDTTDVEVIPAQALSKDNPIMHLMRMADEAPQYLLLGQTGSTTSTSGKLGGDEIHGEVKRENVEAAAEWMGDVFTEQWAKTVVEVNYGNANECPIVEADFTEVGSPEKQATRYATLVGAGIPVLISEMCKDNNLTQPKPGDEVFQGGKVTIFEAPLTTEEHFERDLDQQVQQAEAQASLQAEFSEPAKGSERVKVGVVKARGKTLRRTLQDATSSELDELESKINAAESAPHKNGEVEAVKATVLTLARTKRF